MRSAQITFCLAASCADPAMVIMTEHKMIPASPARWRTLLPSFSMRGMVMKVMMTMIAPTQRVAYWLTEQLIPPSLKKLVE